MVGNAVRKYKVMNPKNDNCPVCSVVNNIYRTDSFQQEMEIPKEAGKGYWRRLIVKPSMEISECDLTFYENMTIKGSPDKPMYGLVFCLGDPLPWRVEGNNQEYEIGCGESYIFNRNQGSGIYSNYYPGQRFLGLKVELDSEIITSIIQHIGKEYSHTARAFGSRVFYKGKISPAIRLILNEMINCRYRNDVKRIYLEGKILELIAVYMDELIFEDGGLYPPVRLSSSDMESLQKARRILDENIVSPPTIGKLARLVCLNEYKLKTGFKELFCMPVHAYVIDKRLEMARLLMEDKKLKVTEAVLLVGYSNASHFAAKFRKKYGVNPSEYI